MRILNPTEIMAISGGCETCQGNFADIFPYLLKGTGIGAATGFSIALLATRGRPDPGLFIVFSGVGAQLGVLVAGIVAVANTVSNTYID